MRNRKNTTELLVTLNRQERRLLEAERKRLGCEQIPLERYIVQTAVHVAESNLKRWENNEIVWPWKEVKNDREET